MDPSNPGLKRSSADYQQKLAAPVLRILSLRRRGMVFESAEPFDIASTIQLGFHLPEPGSPSSGPASEEFIVLRGMVVGCLLCAGSDGSPLYEVTLLFEPGHSDGFAPNRLSRLARLSEHLAKDGAPAMPAGTEIRLEVVGLN